MRPARSFIAIAAAATIGLTGLATPTAQAATEVDLHARLHGSRAFPTAAGFSEYERHGTHREVEVTVRHIARLAGQRVTVFVNYKKVGTMRVSAAGYAHREWDTERGQFVPYAAGGDPVRVRTATGRLVASGWYHRVWHD